MCNWCTPLYEINEIRPCREKKKIVKPISWYIPVYCKVKYECIYIGSTIVCLPW